MSRTILLSPHADDETLFASFLAQRYSAHIVVVYDEGREVELEHATNWLGCSFTQLHAQKGMDVEQVEPYLNGFAEGWDGEVGRVIAPAIEDFGHEEHNLVGALASEVFRDVRDIIRYRTYSPRGTRTHGVPSMPDRPEFIARKLAALSCYRTQMEDVTTRPWFYDLLDMREWTT